VTAWRGAGACAGRGDGYGPEIMSAAEIIEMIEKLPPTEQREVRAYLEQKEKNAPADGVRRMDFEKGVAIGKGIFERHPELFRKLAQ
jgi:hypothetical protein